MADESHEPGRRWARTILVRACVGIGAASLATVPASAFARSPRPGPTSKPSPKPPRPKGPKAPEIRVAPLAVASDSPGDAPEVGENELRAEVSTRGGQAGQAGQTGEAKQAEAVSSAEAATEAAETPSEEAPEAPDSTPPMAANDKTTDALPGPPPFAETSPLLPEIWRLLEAAASTPRALKAGLGVLDDWLARAPDDDGLAVATGEWLRARLLTALDRKKEARQAWEALALSPGAFSDEARLILADLDHEAHWRLARRPGSQDFLVEVRRGLQMLGRQREELRAFELIEQTLTQGMAPRMRAELLLRRAELLVRLNRGPEARRALLETWWCEGPSEDDTQIVRMLKSLKAAPTVAETDLRSAIHVMRGDAPKLATKLGARAKTPLIAALLGRFDVNKAADHGAALLATLTAQERDPLAPLARALVLRKLDRDAEAAEAAEAFVAAHPDHPLAPYARAQAATLYRALGKPERAEPLDQALVGGAPGDLQRDALWRLGFAAVGARGPADLDKADRYLRTLEDRYGGEIDRYGLVWFERARYWRARAAYSAGDRTHAKTLWTDLMRRFPAGWYALLAREHVGGPKDDDAHEVWSVARDDAMATALALYRLGAENDATQAFQALLDARLLPGNGRKLLSDLLEVAGESSRAAQVLRFAAVPATMPGDDAEASGVYCGLYPILHTEAIGAAAHDHNVPRALLAGVVSAETGFHARAQSAPGAIGLAQLMPGTGQTIGKRLFGPSFRAAQLWDPATNLAVAATYLRGLLERFDNHPAIAVAAYNAGPAPVEAWLAARGDMELDAFVETIPFEQARRYVMRVLSDAEIYRRLYQLDPRPITLPRSVGHLSP